MLKPIGLIAGLQRELNCLPGYRGDLAPVMRAAGADSRKAGEIARLLVAKGVSGLLSYGLAGGLAPGLKPGHLIVADAVLTEGGARLSTDDEWRSRFLSRIAGQLPITVGAIAGVDRVIAAPGAKQILHHQTGALAVDMESLYVAEVAKQAGLPFMALRVIADPVHRRIPDWVLASLKPDGEPNLATIVMKAALQPWDWPGLMLLGLAERRSKQSLRLIASDEDPTFGMAVDRD